MTTTLFSYNLELTSILIILLVALLSGMSKTGVHGAGMLAVPLLAIVFGGHSSSGVMLPIIILADIFGVLYYHKHAEWKYLKRLFPWTLVGIIIGTIVGRYIDDITFRMIMAVTIMLSLLVMIYLERRKNEIPHSSLFSSGSGIAGGFSSMVGNLAGTVMAVYFLSMRLPKNAYIGTTAWFFMVINWAKVPFHVFAWHTINTDTFLLGVITLPAILTGAYLGIVITRKLSESVYRWFIIGMTMVSAIVMLF